MMIDCNAVEPGGQTLLKATLYIGRLWVGMVAGLRIKRKDNKKRADFYDQVGA
jgi:hypothetical protein